MGKPRTTFKACRACRLKRARCDGQLPCQRCISFQTDCVYDQRPGETKSKLRDERTELQSHDRAASAILRALADGNDSDAILMSLWQNEPIERIARRVALLQQDDMSFDLDEDALEGDDVDVDMDADPDATLLDQSNNPSSATTEQTDFEPEMSLRDPAWPGNEKATLTQEYVNDDWESQLGLPGRLDTRRASDNASEGSGYCTSLHSPVLFKTESLSPAHSNFALRNVERKPSIGAPIPKSFLVANSPWNSPDLEVLSYPLMEQLIDTFFARQYTPFPVINKGLFLRDFRAGQQGYCSRALVRSIVCLACRIRGGYEAEKSADAAMGNRLFGEATSHLKATDKTGYTMPDAQAFGLLSLHQLGLGEYTSAREFADESLRRIDAQYRQEAEERRDGSTYHTSQATMLFGAISLARMVRLTVGYLFDLAPVLRKGSLAMGLVRAVSAKADAHVEQLLSFPELIQVDLMPHDTPRIPSIMFQLTSWVYCFSARSQICEDDKLPDHLRDTYRACLSWYDSALTNMPNQREIGPFVHLFYHFCLLTLFRPYCHLRSLDAEVSPVDICAESAESILALAKSCSDLGERHLPCFVPLFLYAAGLTEADVIAGCALMKEAQWPASRRGSSASHISSDGTVRHGRLLASRAREQLATLSEMYPSSVKCIVGLEGGLRRESTH